ncbi:hypothetical protein [Haloechinothrix salitolerans]|uniref:Uncharacterized protein n=1 Tax=Haloechinothrix salitolerans TaxID=926830 RepID=A0ABW2C0U0_9PSEU
MTTNTATQVITPQDYGIHVSCATGYLRTAYGGPAAIAYYNGCSWVARPMTDFRPEQPGPHGRWKVPGREVTADTYEDAFAALGFPHDLDLDRPQDV